MSGGAGWQERWGSGDRSGRQAGRPEVARAGRAGGEAEEAGEKRMLIYTGTGRGYPLLGVGVVIDISLPRLSNIKGL